MLIELTNDKKQSVFQKIINTKHELSVKSVLFDSLPGSVWVDHPSNLSCGLVMTPECNVLFGQPSTDEIHAELFKKIGYFGSVTCDTNSWNPYVEQYHQNSGIRKYTRLTLKLKKERMILRPQVESALLVDYHHIDKINYTNKDIISEWINISSKAVPGSLSVAAIIVKNNEIVSCAAVDCIDENCAEIGIKTVEGHRMKGYGLSAVSALVNELFNQGFHEIGWHCVSTNKGSIRIAEAVGFCDKTEYEAYSPFPPIENDSDLDSTEWGEYARFFEKKAEQNANHYWQAAKCWAKAKEMVHSIECIEKLIEKELLWFTDYMDESTEFLQFTHNEEWQKVMKHLITGTKSGVFPKLT
jgi:RimJ/RimL family protein N-acetyltransferase